MKKIFKLLLVGMVTLLASCSGGKKKKADVIDLYKLGSYTSDEYVYNFYSVGSEYFEKDGYSFLIESFSFYIKNINRKNDQVCVNEFKAYGNGKDLNRDLYTDFTCNGSELEYTKATSQTYTIKNGQKEDISYSFIIPQGNKDGYFGIGLKVNDVTVNLYNYYKGEEAKFETTYIHDPSKNAQAMKDIEESSTAYYGYVPSATGSLSSFVDYDYTDKETVLQNKASRIEYHKSNNINIKLLEDKLREEGKTTEEIARACSELRNVNRLSSYDNDPEGLKAVKKRNLETYGNENGPTPEYLFNNYKSKNPLFTDEELWELIITKSYSINSGMDAVLGLYDDMFGYYGIDPMNL